MYDSQLPKTALITGGARGIGWGIAKALLLDRHRVIVTGLNDEEVGDVPHHDQLEVNRLDVRDDHAVDALMKTCARIDILVNCAGIILRGGAEYNIDAFKNVIDVNLTGTMRMCVAAHDKLRDSGSGVIINTASMLSYFGGPLTPAYAASKGGIVQLTKSLAIAWAPDNIRVNAIAPGWIATELTKAARDDQDRNASIMARTPMKRWGTPDDIGGVVAHLCSDAAHYMTGAIIPIDGGYSAN